jgi:protein gp37
MPDLLRINGGHKWVSVEPMLGPIDFYPRPGTGGPIEFAACGPETGPGARECEREWIAAVEDQCEMAGVTFYDKRDSIDPNFLGREWPDAWRKAVTQ